MPNMTWSVYSSGNPEVDSLLIGRRWGLPGTSAVELWYYFPTHRENWTGYDVGADVGELDNNFDPVTDQQKKAVLAAFDLISDYSLLSFRPDPFPHFREPSFAELLFGKTDATEAAHAYGTDAGSDLAGDVWFNNSSGLYDAPVAGNYAFISVLHEIGHAIGLKHPHEAETFGAMPIGLDNMSYTVMSYRSYLGMDIGLGFGNEEFGFAQTYMMYDIAALQHLYGANFEANSADNIYRWNPATGAATNNGEAWITPGANRIFMTVWDGGGTDTYDLSAYTGDVSIDLNPGEWTRTSQTQIVDLGDGYRAIGNIANAFLYKGDTRSLIENATGGSGNDLLVGNQAANTLIGNSGSDTLDGRDGADRMIGGTGDDYYFVGDVGDVVVEAASGGIDKVETTLAAYQMTDHVENLTGTSQSTAQTLTGNARANIIAVTNNLNGNVLDGGGGADRLIGTGFDDTFVIDHAGDLIEDLYGTDTVVSSISYRLTADLENLMLAGTVAINGSGTESSNMMTGNSAANVLSGLGGNDRIDGGAGNDTIDGGAGDDDMRGGAGNDLFIIDTLSDVVTEEADSGIDTVKSAFSYSLGDHVEKLILADGSAANGTGNALQNVLTGNGAANVLDGAAGADRLEGGAGDDVYIVDDAGDLVIEAVGGGTDRILASASYVLRAGAHVELVATASEVGTTAISLGGNELANIIHGNAGTNVLNGNGGADRMVGLAGNDTYFVDNAGDLVIEETGGGTDRILSSVSYTLRAGVAVETLSTINAAGTAAISFAGNELANILYGNAGANVLNGNGGADQMAGYGGNDIYYVDNSLDLVAEAAGAGTDRILASVSYALRAGAHVETLSTTNVAGTDAINLGGNELANILYGNAGANTLNGNGGIDQMAGYGGNDIYFVDQALDLAFESVGGGSDRVYASVSYALRSGSEVEIISTTNNAGTAAINLGGNEFAQILYGNAGANVLNGGGGADTLSGFGGNDQYFVDQAGDLVFEAAGGGSDRIFASASYTLQAGSEVETLSTTNNAGTAAINLTGNELANTIYGNAGANVLNGGAGADTLSGFGGADTFAFTAALGGGNFDWIVQFEVGVDEIALDDAVFTGLGLGALSAAAFHTGSAAADADDRIVYDAATGALFFDADGSGAGAAVQFAILETGLALGATDFVVI